MLRVINSEKQPRIRRGGSREVPADPEENGRESVGVAGGSQAQRDRNGKWAFKGGSTGTPSAIFPLRFLQLPA